MSTFVLSFPFNQKYVSIEIGDDLKVGLENPQSTSLYKLVCQKKPKLCFRIVAGEPLSLATLMLP